MASHLLCITVLMVTLGSAASFKLISKLVIDSNNYVGNGYCQIPEDTPAYSPQCVGTPEFEGQEKEQLKMEACSFTFQNNTSICLVMTSVRECAVDSVSQPSTKCKVFFSGQCLINEDPTSVTAFVANSEKYGDDGYEYQTAEDVQCGSDDLMSMVATSTASSYESISEMVINEEHFPGRGFCQIPMDKLEYSPDCSGTPEFERQVKGQLKKEMCSFTFENGTSMCLQRKYIRTCTLGSVTRFNPACKLYSLGQCLIHEEPITVTEFVNDSDKYGDSGHDYEVIEHVKCGSNELIQILQYKPGTEATTQSPTQPPTQPPTQTPTEPPTGPPPPETFDWPPAMQPDASIEHLRFKHKTEPTLKYYRARENRKLVIPDKSRSVATDSGTVVSWTAMLMDTEEIQFSFWRQGNKRNKFTYVGGSTITAQVSGTQTVELSADQQFNVQKGDMIGIYRSAGIPITYNRFEDCSGQQTFVVKTEIPGTFTSGQVIITRNQRVCGDPLVIASIKKT